MHDATSTLKTSAERQAEKRIATLRARLALAGYQLDGPPAEDGGVGFSVHRWDTSLRFPDIGAVEAFAARLHAGSTAQLVGNASSGKAAHV